MTRSVRLRPDHCADQPSSLGRAVARGFFILAVLALIGAAPALATESPTLDSRSPAQRIDTLRSLLALQYPHLRSVEAAEAQAGLTGAEAGAAGPTASPSL